MIAGVRRRFRHDVERHVRVLMPAELGALAAIRPLLVHLKPNCVTVARYQVALALYVGRPEAVDHITRASLQNDRYAGRNVNLIRRDDQHAGIRVWIPHFPPPLVPDDLNAHGVLRRQRVHVLPRDYRVAENSEQHKHSYDRRGYDHSQPPLLDQRIGVQFRRQLLGYSSSGRSRGEQRKDDDEDDKRNRENEPPQALNARRHRADGLQHCLLRLLSPARRQQQTNSSCADQFADMYDTAFHRCFGGFWEIVAYVRSMSGQLPPTVAPARSDEMNVKKPENVTPGHALAADSLSPAFSGG